MAVQHLFVPADEPPGTPNGSNDGTDYTLGYTMTFATDGNVLGMRAFGPTSNSPDPQRGKLFRKSDEVLLGFVDFDIPVSFGVWNSKDFAAPVPVLAGVEYVVSYYTDGTGPSGFGHTAYDENGLAADKVNGDLTAHSGTGALKSGSALDDFPDNTSAIPNFLFWIDVNFEAAGAQVIDVGTAFEVDQGLPIAAVKQAGVGTAFEVDTALEIEAVKQAGVDTAFEVDRGLAIAAQKVVAVGTAFEVDRGLEIAAVKQAAVGTAFEVDSAFEIGAVKQAGVGTAFEVDRGLEIAAQHQVTVGTAFEVDRGLEIAAVKQAGVGTAFEVDTALPITPDATIVVDVGTAFEVDRGLAIAAVKQVPVGTAFEVDRGLPVPPSPVHQVPVGTAFEVDRAIEISTVGPQVIDVGTARETDFALPIPRKLTPGVPALAHLIWAVARMLRDCLCTRLLETVGGAVCRCSLMAGDQAIADICEKNAHGDGQAWVRMTRFFVTNDFPRPMTDEFDCAGGLWAAEFELGVLRCAVTSDDDGQPPSAEELNAEVAKVMDDAFVLRWAAECCLPSGLPSIPGEWQPMSGGLCTGGRVTVMVYLVPGPIAGLPTA